MLQRGVFLVEQGVDEQRDTEIPVVLALDADAGIDDAIGPLDGDIVLEPGGVAIALFCVGGFAHQMVSGALITLCADMFDTRTVGTASGMAGTFAWVDGMSFTLPIGQSADVFGYDPLFAALAGLDLLAAAVLWSLLRANSTVPRSAS